MTGDKDDTKYRHVSDLDKASIIPNHMIEVHLNPKTFLDKLNTEGCENRNEQQE